MDLVLDIVVEHRLADTAVAQVRERQARLIAALGAAGAELTLSHLGVDPVHDWDGQRSELRGFQARVTLTATTRRLEQVGELQAAAGAGATGMRSLFRRSDLDALKATVRSQAIAAAITRAQETAAALGVPLGLVRAIVDASRSAMFDNVYFPPVGSSGGGLGGDLQQPLTLEVTVIARARMTGMSWDGPRVKRARVRTRSPLVLRAPIATMPGWASRVPGSCSRPRPPSPPAAAIPPP